ncbi:MAG: 3-isopropylmalate dehydratase large subunit [Candidatus Brockarchaeota archaeon]|nr:3-isopropylmalate dehydratase large subunit [Candidatus Brockarchaeota archaeon]
MAKTMSEKIIGEHAGRSVSAGETVIASVDLCFTHDASGPLLISQLKELGLDLQNPRRTAFFVDHAVPAPRRESANDQKIVREFAKKAGAGFHEAGSGICHQLVAEEYALPGQIVLGTDSHTVTAGALGAFATGMGATDMAVAMALGKTWLRVPETLLVKVTGELGKGVFSKDVALHLVGTLGSEGANYKSVEFSGETVERMETSQRLTLSNMVVEAGAKAGLVPSDLETKRFLESLGREGFRRVFPDKGAQYEDTIEVEAGKLRPMVALPGSVDNVKPVEEVGEVEIDIVFVGSCTNGRIEDLRVVAKILSGRKLREGVRLVVTPSSRRTLVEAVKDGTLQTLIGAGAAVTPPGCGVCFGALGGVPADGERILASTNRNFKARTGNPEALTYLASPAVCAATAVKGVIADPGEFL